MVIAEVGYLLARDADSSVESRFLRSFKTGFLDIVSPTADDLVRAAELVEQYADLPLGTTDACIVALAERLNITELVALDLAGAIGIKRAFVASGIEVRL